MKKVIITVSVLAAIYFLIPKKMEENNSIIPIGKQAFINFITLSAKMIEKKYKIPYKFIVAQLGLETAWGKSSLTQKAFNFAGIKAKAGEPYIEMMTKEFLNGQMVSIPQKFWKGSNVVEGLEKYVKVLLLPRYKEAFKYTDPEKFAIEIKKGGYCTDPNYVKKLVAIFPSIK